MARMPKLTCLLALAILSSLKLGGPAPALQDRPDANTIRVRSGEVVVDLSITDGSGKPVRGLKQGDFEVYEDGVKQKIESFRFISAGAPPVEAAPVQPNADESKSGREMPRSTTTHPRLVSIVFDKINTERGDGPRAAAAARGYAERLFTKDDLASVYGIGAGIQIYQAFTHNRESLLNGIKAATAANAGVPGDLAEAIRASLQQIPSGMIPGVSSDADKIALAYSGGGGIMAQMLEPILTELRTLLIFQEYDRQIRSDRSLAGLLSIINSQKIIPARKCLLFISSGFAIPAGGDNFRAVLNAANRAGVTIYTIDASGLRATDPDEERRLAQEAALKSKNTAGLRTPIGLMERAAGLNPLDTLERLAEGTGGYTVKNTNDLAGGVERLGVYLGEYYVLTYTPANLIPDGRFRNISVKLNRGGLSVRARNGYYAFPDTDRLPLLGYEVELLEDLNAKSPPAKFPAYVGGLLFPALGGTTTSALIVQFPLSELKVEKRSNTRSYTVQADVLLIVKGRDGGVLHRMSRQYDMEGSLEMLESTLKRSFSFCRRVALPPGDYVLEAIVRDRRTGKASVKKIDFHVDTNYGDGIRLSSIVLCRESSISARQDSQDASAIGPAMEDPLRAAGAPVIPDLSGAFSASSEKEMGIYLVACSRDASAAMKATYEFVREGVSILKFEHHLPAPDDNGQIRQLAMVDLGKLKPGEYELKVTAGNAQGTASGKAVFLVRK